MKWFSSWFTDPIDKDAEETQKQEDLALLSDLLEEQGLTLDEVIAAKDILRNPKLYALQTLDMSLEEYSDFKRSKTLPISQRVKELVEKRLTSLNNFSALMFVIKDTEKIEGTDDIKEDKWKYTPSLIHLEEALNIVNYMVKNKVTDQTLCAKACVRLYYAVYVSLFQPKGNYQKAQMRLNDAEKDKLIAKQILPAEEVKSIPAAEIEEM